MTKAKTELGKTLILPKSKPTHAPKDPHDTDKEKTERMEKSPSKHKKPEPEISPLDPGMELDD